MRNILFIFMAIFSVQVWAQNAETMQELAGVYKISNSSYQLKQTCDMTLKIKYYENEISRYEIDYDKDQCFFDETTFVPGLVRLDVIKLGYNGELYKILNFGEYLTALYRDKNDIITITVFDVLYTNDGYQDLTFKKQVD